MKRMLLIDGNFLMFQSFYATYNPYNSYIMQNSEGVTTNGTYQFFNMLFNLIDYLRPEYLFIAFDAPGKTFRHQQIQDYKAGRSKAPEIIFDQFKNTKQILDELNIKHSEIVSYEADDLIATLNSNIEADKFIYSKDKDLLQLVQPNTQIILKDTKINDFVFTNIDNFFDKYQMQPDQIPDFKGLFGDTSDNLSGVKGVGEKTAIKLLAEYKNLENIYQNLDKLTPALKTKLANDKENAFLCKKLALLEKNVPNLSTNLQTYQLNLQPNFQTLEKLQLNRIIKKIKDYVNSNNR
ncbi:5'-3' exonuclease [Mycoplasmopsis ciconiae]|uniref:5'-3' exonuclease n=1 Tax=Mycoplasmopsis ciconiae TaxID=561067 RepID=A0ABU7MKH6_9BACT|nr:5'-3' exonuclease [Mycoplasmopsis ciconiae]